MDEKQPVLSVSEISISIKSCVEQVFSSVYVKGEVSDLKKASSGHIYFTLKDKEAVLSAICWRGANSETISALKEGLEVICRGKISTYPGRSSYQIIIDFAEPAGVGALLKLLQERKEKLEKEGLFDLNKKKPIPYLPEVIGVITSPTGAVIQDIIHRISDRFPSHILLWPVPVQGEGAELEIQKAIEGFNAIPKHGLEIKGKKVKRPQVIIVARGGGSLEDLWCFNEECVVRAVSRSEIPIISAVGHETDTTLIDYVSDLRAPTPTGAAEKAVPVFSELLVKFNSHQNRLTEAIYRELEEKQEKVRSLSRMLPNLTEVIQNFFQKLDDKVERVQIGIKNILVHLTQKTESITQLLESYSYKNVLKRGFAFVTHQKEIVTKVEQAKTKSILEIHFQDGETKVVPLVKKINKKEKNDEPSFF